MRWTLGKIISIGVLGALLAAPASADWRYVRDVDPITDQVDQYVVTKEINGQGTLAVKCFRYPQGHLQFSLAIELGDIEIPKEGAIPKVISRIDKNDPVTHGEYDWMRMAGSRTAYSKANQRALFERMKQGKRFVLRIIDETAVYTRFFDLTGLRTAAQQFDC